MQEEEPSDKDKMRWDRLPSEMWLNIFSYLDLETQHIMGRTCRDMLTLVCVLWRNWVTQIKRNLDKIAEDHRKVKHNVVMAAMISDHDLTDKITCSSLYALLRQHKHLGSGIQKFSSKKLLVVPQMDFSGQNVEYEFFHEYDKPRRKYLDLNQKWPRPGSKSLTKFLGGNKDLVYLEVTDCRENIEAVHFLTSNCLRLEALRLFATDPLLTYTEILKLKHLKYLEIQFDSFYREHRDQFLYSLGSLSQLKVAKFHTCFGMTDDHVLSILSSCRSLNHLQLPINGKVNGWFLETLLEYLKNPTEVFTPKLTKLDMHINSAYAQLETVIPELHVFNLVKEALKFGLILDVRFCHKKQPSFNPKGYYI